MVFEAGKKALGKEAGEVAEEIVKKDVENTANSNKKFENSDFNMENKNLNKIKIGNKNFLKLQIEYIQTKTPEQLIANGWKDITNPKMAINTNSRELYNPKIGLRIRFDKGVKDANGFEAMDHYHIINNNYTNKKLDYYYDINGNPVGKGSTASHIVIRGGK